MYKVYTGYVIADKSIILKDEIPDSNCGKNIGIVPCMQGT
jgi:hypothetical protein